MSYVQILIHAVVRTYKSENTLPTDNRIKFLYQDMYGIIKNKGGYLYRINSMSEIGIDSRVLSLRDLWIAVVIPSPQVETCG